MAEFQHVWISDNTLLSLKEEVGVCILVHACRRPDISTEISVVVLAILLFVTQITIAPKIIWMI